MFENPQYVAIGNTFLQMFLTSFSDQWLERWLPALQESDAGAALAPVLTDAICWYMLYELKKNASGDVEAQFHAQNPDALAVLRFRSFGQPVLEHEPPIVLGNRPNQFPR